MIREYLANYRSELPQALAGVPGEGFEESVYLMEGA